MKANTYYLNACTIIFYFILLLYSSVVFSQAKGIILKDKKTEEIEFLKENKRIKVFTIDGTNYTGRFKIIDDNTIMIDGINIPLDSIMKIKRRSVTSAIIETTFYVYGGIIVVACIVAVAIDPLFLIVIPVSFPFIGAAILVPGLENGHKLKRWTYSIGINEPTPD
ncbi:MAG: hypothetical protein H7339_10810 [Arcicella sp.]|nr:hypothetical protein [Arcicella sp.]